MTKMYVAEYAGLAATAQSDSIPVPAEPPLASYVVDYTAGVASGPVYQPSTKFLLVTVDSICCVSFNGVAASTSNLRIPTGIPPLLVGVGGAPMGKASGITALA